MTQTQLSAKTGIGQSTLSEIEKGEIANPGADVMDKLCAVLNSNAAWLLRGSGQGGGPTDVAQGFDEVEALHLFKQLDEGRRQSWLVAGRTLLTHQLGHQTEHEPYRSVSSSPLKPPRR